MKKKIIIIGSAAVIIVAIAFGLASFLVSKVESFKKLSHADVFATQINAIQQITATRITRLIHISQ
jgi:uncharacterized membrane protein